MALAEYARKRDFKKTAEPGAVHGKGNQHRFVIQKHAASRLHYDFRLELGGVLKSWAVPKGVPYVKGEKRLAVQVEDHPVSYIHFEGSIPKGQYGGGTVMVWDEGTFEAEATAPLEELKRGKLHFRLDGKKLKGEWYLVQLRGSNQWLLIKGGDTLKPVSKKADDTSAWSGKSMKQLGENGAVWESKPKKGKDPVIKKIQPRAAAKAVRSAVRGEPVKFIEPMKAELKSEAPTDPGWIYEIKFDGFRTLAYANGEEVELLSRNEKSFIGKFPEIAQAVAKLKLNDAILDGEIVALDPNGVSSFQLLQAYETGKERPPIYFYAFDLLRIEGVDIRNEVLLERKAQLEAQLKKSKGLVRYSASLGEEAKPLLKRVRELGLEGLIGKRMDSVYEAGRRSSLWIKLKLQREQEFVIGGYTDPEGSRNHFGALLLGFYADKKFKFCGKVGTGFNEARLKAMHERFEELERRDCPFVNVPESRRGRFGAGLTAAEMKRCHWLKPELVCQVKFSEWTRDDKLRQPVFLGLREDKPAREVVQEKVKVE